MADTQTIDYFEDSYGNIHIKNLIAEMRLSHEKVRKRLFKELADIRQQVNELRDDYDRLREDTTPRTAKETFERSETRAEFYELRQHQPSLF